MSDMKAFYTCSSVSTPDALRRAGATPLQLSYTYEVDTPLIALENGSTTDDGILSDAVDRVQRVTLQGVAERSGLTDCVVRPAENGNNWRHLEGDHDEDRRLLPKQRGATSIVGVSLEPGDVVEESGEFVCFHGVRRSTVNFILSAIYVDNKCISCSATKFHHTR